MCWEASVGCKESQQDAQPGLVYMDQHRTGSSSSTSSSSESSLSPQNHYDDEDMNDADDCEPLPWSLSAEEQQGLIELGLFDMTFTATPPPVVSSSAPPTVTNTNCNRERQQQQQLQEQHQQQTQCGRTGNDTSGRCSTTNHNHRGGYADSRQTPYSNKSTATIFGNDKSFPGITFRPIQIGDRAQVKALHEEWFPVTYQDEFYEELAKGRMSQTGDPLYTCLATTTTGSGSSSNTVDAAHNDNNNKNNENEIPEQQQQPHVPLSDWQLLLDPAPNMVVVDNAMIHDMKTSQECEDVEAGSCQDTTAITMQETNDILASLGSFGHLEDEEDNQQNGGCVCTPCTPAPPPSPPGSASVACANQQRLQEQFCSSPKEEEERIVACVVGSFVNARRLSTETRSVLISNPHRYTRLFYIMTLGTRSDYRKGGMGTALVKRCMALVEKDPSCGVLYLHVITFNVGAIRLYEKLGFYRVQEIPDYYCIDGKRYSCYLYAKYFHGNLGHRGLYYFFKRAVSAVWNQFKKPLSYLLESTNTADDEMEISNS